jgi:NAD+ diphosphatase
MNRTNSPEYPAHHAVFSVTALAPRFPITHEVPAQALWILVSHQRVAIKDGDNPQIYSQAGPRPDIRSLCLIEYLGHRGEVPCYAAGLPDDTSLPEGWTLNGVRELYGRILDEDLANASFAARMIGSAETSRFCGRCGHETESVLSERSKRCPACGLVSYSRISPAIIVLIMRGDEILLARSPRFPEGMRSVIAGFAEPGETLEDAVRREVKEEVGISVKNIRYFASEPWPFPDSLMIGFVADYASGEIVIDNNEIVSAGWFKRDNLPMLPQQMSISRALIDYWINLKSGL